MIRPYRILLVLPFLLAAAAPDPAERATPRSSPGGWLTDADYPADAQRQKQDGTAGFRLDIDPTGTPVNCTITSSTGVASLDSATCARMMERARFTPAKDTKGREVADVYNGRITWRLPNREEGVRPLPPMPFRHQVTFTIDDDGIAFDCSVTLNGVTTADTGQCRDIVTHRYVPQQDAAGKPVAQRVRMTTTFEKVDTPR